MARANATRNLISAWGLLTLPAQVDTNNPVLGAGNDTALSLDTSGRLRVTAGAAAGAFAVFNVEEGVADATGNTGSAVAPLAGAAIVTLAAPPAGDYEIIVWAAYGGTADVINNMDFRRGGTVISVLLVPAAVNLMPTERRFFLTLTGAQALTVNAIAAGGAGSVFNAEIIAKRTS